MLSAPKRLALIKLFWLAVPSGQPSWARAASSKDRAEFSANLSKVACAISASSWAAASPIPFFWRLNNCAPRRAALPSNSVNVPSTCAASVGVKADNAKRPRLISRSIAPSATCDVAISATGDGPAASAAAANFCSALLNHSGIPSGINGITKRPSVACGTGLFNWVSRCPIASGQSRANKESGMARRGPNCRPLARPLVSGVTSESPPRPEVRISAASTIVRQPPT